MDVRAMRRCIRKSYPGYKWQKRVDRMKTDQVIAVFKRLEEEQPDRLDKSEMYRLALGQYEIYVM